MAYRIRDWCKLFENNRTRELKRMDWVPVPNRMDGEGYTELVDHQSGAAHLGAWLAIIEIASRRDVRGTLPQGGSAALARISRLPEEIFDEVIPRLVEIGWIEIIPDDNARDFIEMQRAAGKPQEAAGLPQEGAALEPQDDAALRARGRVTEGKGTEGKGTEIGAREWADEFYQVPITLQDLFGELARCHPKPAELFKASQNFAFKVRAKRIGAWNMEKIISMHASSCKSEDWAKEGGRYAPKLKDWIDGEQWSDRAPPASSNGKSGGIDYESWDK